MRIRLEIERLLHTLHLDRHREMILRIGTQMAANSQIPPTELTATWLDFLTIDSQIQGLGFHNLNVEGQNGQIIGAYRIVHRPIFRPLQYAEAQFTGRNIEWAARDIIRYSGMYIEKCLKAATGYLYTDASINYVLANARGLDSELKEVLRELNRSVYRNAQHEIEDIIEEEHWDEHMFSVADAIAVYFICRELGARLLQDSGITGKDGELIFGQA